MGDWRLAKMRHRLMTEGPRGMAMAKKERDLAASEKRFQARKSEAVYEAREVERFMGQSHVNDNALILERAPVNVKSRVIYSGTLKIEQEFEDGVLVKETETRL